ncbi:MAG: SHOCT domain-containing protein [Gillisia sp.]
MMNHFNDQFWGMNFLSWIILVVFIIAIVLWIKNPNNVREKKENPLEILKRRFAKGEITQEEYEEARKTIIK